MQPLVSGSPPVNNIDDPDQKAHPTSAPPPSQSNSKQNLGECLRSTCSSNETKIRCTIPSERLAQLRKIVDDAIRNHKTFTIKGGWQTLRHQFLLRGWLEKYENSVVNTKQKPIKDSMVSMEDICVNLPTKQDWESQSTYIIKCEKTVMSRMLNGHSVDFYWNMRREVTDWHHRVNTQQIMNRFARSLFTSKEGLNLLLQQMHWHCEPGISVVNFPRCYTLGFPDHFNNFIDDFRMTACVCLLKWFVNKLEREDEYAIKSPEGRVPYSAIKFALDRCHDYIASQQHLDIDKDLVKIWNHEWDQFLSHYYLIVHERELILDSKEWTVTVTDTTARTTLNEMAKYWPMIDVDGMNNIWILKPGNKCRGRGIQLVKYMEDVSKIMNLKLKYVVQKYIERPLLIYATKFDIRQWFMVTSVQPLNVWMYRECYLRFSTQIFNLENFHESLHLTNHAVQCKYANVIQRDKKLPEQNMWDCYTFRNYLTEIGHGDKWDAVIFPGMRENIVGSMLACQDTMDRRPNTFELYGADFVIAEDFKPWLLEINSSPDLSPSTNVTSRMCPRVLQDIVKVLVDKRRNVNSETGLFDLVYKQILPRPPAYLGMNLSLRGRRLFKNKKLKQKDQKDKENKDAQISTREISPNIMATCKARILNKDIYKGPIIADLIEDLHHTIHPDTSGFEFFPANPSQPSNKKGIAKQERVSKFGSSKNKTNKCHYFINRKRNLNETSKATDTHSRKPVNLFAKSTANFATFQERKINNNLLEKSDKVEVLSKFNIKNVTPGNIGRNKKCKPTPRCCLSSINLSFALPQLHHIESQFNLNHPNCNRLSKFSSDDQKEKSVSANTY